MEHLTQVLLTLFILSLVAERLTNFLKLKREKLRLKKAGSEEKERQLKILRLAVLSGLMVAAIVKADFFEMINPQHEQGITSWEVYLSQWKAVEGSKIWLSIRLIIGIIITGLFISQGSKFFHDLLDIMLQFKVGRETVAKVATTGKTLLNNPEFEAFTKKEVQHLVFFEDRDDEQDNHL